MQVTKLKNISLVSLIKTFFEAFNINIFWENNGEQWVVLNANNNLF